MAIKVSGVSLKVEGAAAFKTELDKANSALRKNKAEMEKLDATYGKGSTDREYLSQRQEQLTARLEAQKMRTETLRQARDAYAAQADATAEGIEKLDLAVLKSETQEAAFQRQLNETNQALAQQEEAAQEAGDSQKQLAQDTAKAGAEADSAAKKWEQAAGKIGSMGKKLTVGVTTPLVGLGTMMVKEAMSLEDAMYTVATLPGVAAEEIPAYTQAILEASAATGVAAAELAAAQYQAISAGQAAESSVDFVEKAAKAAKAGLTDTSTVVDGATSILNAWGAAAGGVEHVLDALAVTQNEGKTTIGDVASQIGQLTGLAPQLNISLDDTLAAVAALTKNGVGTSQAINGLKAVMSNVIKPTAQAGEAAKKLGLDFSAAALQSQGLSGFLAEVMEKTGGDTEILAKLFGSVEGLNQVMLLGGAAAGDYADILGKLGSSAGAMEEAFSTRTSSRMEKVNASMNRLKNAGMDLAEGLLPAADAVAGFLSGAGEMLGGLDEGAQKAVVSVLGATAAVGPLLSAASKLMTMGPALKALFSGPAGWITLAVGGLAALGIHLANLKSPIDEMMDSIDGRLENLDVKVSESSVAAMTAAINSGIDAAKKEHALKVKISTQIDQATDMTEDAFQDGRMDWQEYKGFSSWVNTYVVPDIQEGKRLVAQERKDFLATLNGQVGEDGKPLTNAQKQEMADAAVAPLQGIVTALENAKNDYQALLQVIYQNGGTATEAEIARLQELLVLIGQYQTELKIAEDDAMSFMQKQYENVVSGHGSETETGASFGYVKTLYEEENKTLDEKEQELERSRTEAVNAAADNAEALAAAEASYEQQTQALEAARQQAEAGMYEGLNDIFAGIAMQDPAGAEWLSQVNERIALLDKLKKASDELSATAAQRDLRPEDMLPYQTDEWMDLWELVAKPTESPWAMMLNPDIYSPLEWFARAMDMTADDIKADMADGSQAEGIMSAFEAMLNGMDIESLDFSQFSGALADAMRLHMVQEEGLDAVGSEAMDAIGNGAEEEADAAGLAAGGAFAGSVAAGIDSERPAVLASVDSIMTDAQAAVGAGIAIPVYTVPQGLGTTGVTGSAGGTGGVSYATNVTIMRANLTNRASVEGLAREIVGLQRAKQAGVGVIG